MDLTWAEEDFNIYEIDDTIDDLSEQIAFLRGLFSCFFQKPLQIKENLPSNHLSTGDLGFKEESIVTPRGKELKVQACVCSVRFFCFFLKKKTKFRRKRASGRGTCSRLASMVSGSESAVTVSGNLLMKRGGRKTLFFSSKQHKNNRQMAGDASNPNSPKKPSRSSSLIKTQLEEENDSEEEVDFAMIAKFALNLRNHPISTPEDLPSDLEQLEFEDWKMLGCFLAQQRFKNLDNSKVLEFVSSEKRKNVLLMFVFHEFDFKTLDIELAFRVFLERLGYVPKEGMKQARLIAGFGARYFFDCPQVVASETAATHLASGLFMLHTMLHNVKVSKNFAFNIEDWFEHNDGLNEGEDWDKGMLADAFANVRDAEFIFQDEDQANHVVKHGWLELKEQKSSGSTIRRTLRSFAGKLTWGVIVNGALYLSKHPGALNDAFLTISLERAVVHRLAEQNALGLDYYVGEKVT
jgi:hypothetical protein